MAQTPLTGLFWHCTTMDRVAGILRQGILAAKLRKRRQERRWVNGLGTALGDPNAVYLISTFRQAIRWAIKMERDWGMAPGNVVILAVRRPDNLHVEPSAESQMAGNTHYFTLKPIPPNEIQGKVMLTPELRRAFFQDAITPQMERQSLARTQSVFRYQTPLRPPHEGQESFTIEVSADTARQAAVLAVKKLRQDHKYLGKLRGSVTLVAMGNG